MGDILSKYDLLAAFGTTVLLAVFATIGSLILGTVVAVLRVSPVRVLRLLGTSYVNIFRNTPLTLLMVFSVLGLTYILGINLDTTDIKRQRLPVGDRDALGLPRVPSYARPCAQASTPSQRVRPRRLDRSG